MDRSIAGWVTTIRSPSLDGLMRGATWFGGATWSLLALPGLTWLAWRRGGSRAVRIFLVSFLLAALVEIVLRLLGLQWRPGTTALPVSMSLRDRFQMAGFPSGHTFRAAFTFGWLARLLDWKKYEREGEAFCLVMILVVSLSRVYLNRHWTTDVLGAWLVVLITFALVRRWEESGA